MASKATMGFLIARHATLEMTTQSIRCLLSMWADGLCSRCQFVLITFLGGGVCLCPGYFFVSSSACCVCWTHGGPGEHKHHPLCYTDFGAFCTQSVLPA